MTGGHPRHASPAALAPVVALWHAALEQAAYVWLTGDTVAQIPWNSGLYGYFRRHFRLIGLAGRRGGTFRGQGCTSGTRRAQDPPNPRSVLA